MNGSLWWLSDRAVVGLVFVLLFVLLRFLPRGRGRWLWSSTPENPGPVTADQRKRIFIYLIAGIGMVAFALITASELFIQSIGREDYWRTNAPSTLVLTGIALIGLVLVVAGLRRIPRN